PAWFRPNYRMDNRTRLRIELLIMIKLAGGLAETQWCERVKGRRLAGCTPEQVAQGAVRDQERALDLALLVTNGSSDEAAAFLEWLRLRTDRELKDPITWGGVQHLADALAEHPTLSYRRAQGYIFDGFDRALRRSRAVGR
ncbi:MAG TPA: hypothetical protein VMH41_15795, partial [Mycobacteriales bacterium]|nr:hypothetical protein [Mycobacteriales bacterium]